MTGALSYLTWCTLRNRLRVRLRRLREPRYLIGLFVGLFYFYFVLYRRPSSRGQGSSGMIGVFDRYRGTAELGGGLVLFALTILAWIWPRPSAVLAFSQSEVQFLFTAPVTRAELIRYKVFRSQLAVFIGSALMTIFFRPTSLASGWMFFLGTALLMGVINLHFMGVALRRQSLSEHGRAGVARQWLPIAVLAAGVLTLAAVVAGDWTRLSALTEPTAVIGELQRLSGTWPAAAVLWPFRSLVRLPISETPADFLLALPGCLLLLFLNYRWVVRSDASFEEASAQAAETLAERVRQGRRVPAAKLRRTRVPFPLALDGRPEFAILWKNLILLGRYASITIFVRVALVTLVIGFFASRAGSAAGLSTVVTVAALWIASFTVLLGPQMARNDLRQDLAQLAVLKTWPIRGAALIRGEVAAPVVVLTAVTWLSIATAAIFASGLPSRTIDLSGQDLAAAAVAAALVAPGVIAVQVLLQNAVAVLFPAWVAIGGAAARGVDVMGQRMVMMAGLFLVLAVALVPAAIAASGTAYVVYLIRGTVPLVVPSIVAAVCLAVECLIASEALGGLLDRSDIASVDPAAP